MKIHELAYIGDAFYVESGTVMSSLINVGLIDPAPGRWDWGKVTAALKNGDAVHIRPATTQEVLDAHKRLESIKRSYPQVKEK